jgi:hypothetical protein
MFFSPKVFKGSIRCMLERFADLYSLTTQNFSLEEALNYASEFSDAGMLFYRTFKSKY